MFLEASASSNAHPGGHQGDVAQALSCSASDPPLLALGPGGLFEQGQMR